MFRPPGVGAEDGEVGQVGGGDVGLRAAADIISALPKVKCPRRR
jgi:hypothetical protein